MNEPAISVLAQRSTAVVLLLLLTWVCARAVRSVAVFRWCVWIAGLASAGAVFSWQIEIRLPGLLAGLALFAGSWWLGNYWYRSALIWLTNEGIPFPWRWAAAGRIAVVAAGVALASESTGFATTLIRNAFLILRASAALALAQASSPLLRSLWSSRAVTTHHSSDDPLFR